MLVSRRPSLLLFPSASTLSASTSWHCNDSENFLIFLRSMRLRRNTSAKSSFPTVALRLRSEVALPVNQFLKTNSWRFCERPGALCCCAPTSFLISIIRIRRIAEEGQSNAATLNRLKQILHREATKAQVDKFAELSIEERKAQLAKDNRGQVCLPAMESLAPSCAHAGCCGSVEKRRKGSQGRAEGLQSSRRVDSGQVVARGQGAPSARGFVVARSQLRYASQGPQGPGQPKVTFL